MDKCKLFLETYKSFEWFILRYFSDAKLDELIELAKNNDSKKLSEELENIWYYLPDNIFNIKNNPEGWSEFLNILED